MKLWIVLPATLLATLYLGHQANNAQLPTPERIRIIQELQEELKEETRDCLTDTECAMTSPALETFEDGSGYDPISGISFPEGTFPWDCATMGNRICGPTD